MYTINDKAAAIREVQRFLLLFGQYNDNFPHLSVDGIFSDETRLGVVEFQKTNNLPVTGKVERKTFDLLYLEYVDLIYNLSDGDVFNKEAFPLKIGERGNDIVTLNTIIQELSYYYKNLRASPGDFYSEDTEYSVKEMQEHLREKITGIVTEKFLLRLKSELKERQKFKNS